MPLPITTTSASSSWVPAEAASRFVSSRLPLLPLVSVRVDCRCCRLFKTPLCPCLLTTAVRANEPPTGRGAGTTKASTVVPHHDEAQTAVASNNLPARIMLRCVVVCEQRHETRSVRFVDQNASLHLPDHEEKSHWYYFGNMIFLASSSLVLGSSYYILVSCVLVLLVPFPPAYIFSTLRPLSPKNHMHGIPHTQATPPHASINYTSRVSLSYVHVRSALSVSLRLLVPFLSLLVHFFSSCEILHPKETRPASKCALCLDGDRYW